MITTVTCSSCGEPIGQVVTLDDVSLLRIGQTVCRSFHGYCVVCGSEFHWSFSDVILDGLIKRMLTNRL